MFDVIKKSLIFCDSFSFKMRKKEQKFAHENDSQNLQFKHEDADIK